jgi:hypothetical protein
MGTADGILARTGTLAPLLEAHAGPVRDRQRLARIVELANQRRVRLDATVLDELLAAIAEPLLEEQRAAVRAELLDEPVGVLLEVLDLGELREISCMTM